MKPFFSVAAILVAMSLSSSPNAFAGDVTFGDLMISHPTARPNLPNRPTAGYMVIMNHGTKGDVLISASSSAFKKIELHNVFRDGDVMKMQPVEGVEVPAGDTAMLAPGGYHLMLFDAVQRFKDGESFPITLTFQNAGEVEITVNVDRRAGNGHDHSGQGAKTPEGSKDDHGEHKHNEHKSNGHSDGGHKHNGHKQSGASE